MVKWGISKLETKLILPIAATMLVVIGIVFYVYELVRKNQEFILESSANITTVNNLSNQLGNHQDLIHANLLAYVFSRDERQVEAISQHQQATDETVDKLKGYLTSGEGLEYFTQYQKRREGLRQLRTDLTDALRSNDQQRIDLVFSRWKVRSERVSAALHDLTNYNTNTLERVSEKYRELSLQLYALVVLMVVGAVLFIVGLYFYLGRVVTRRILALSLAAARMEAGYFDSDIAVSGTDEISGLAEDLKSMAGKLREYHKDLEERVQAREEELAKNKQMEERKDQFLSVASHELKTPLTSIKGYVQILERLVGKLGDSRAIEYVEKTNKHIDKLNDLISDLLDISRIQAGKMKFNMEPFPYMDLVKESIESAQSISDSHKIKLYGRKNYEVRGDKDRLGQVFANIISNAVKYSPNANTVEVRVTQDKDFVRTQVKDSGIGIPREELPNIFGKFYRVGSVERRFSGLGIGLYISSEIVLRHGGKIWVESEEGKGSTFTFTLPLLQQ